MGGVRVGIRAPVRADEKEFLALVAASRRLHHPWVQPPASPAAFREYVDRPRDRFLPYLLVRADGGPLVGVVNASEIVRGVFQSAYLGYYAFAPAASTGCFAEGMARVLSDLFREQGLHRVEANIQPGNERSLRLVKRLGFRREGLSPRYLKLGGQWRDHERWALLAEEWKPSQRAGRSRP